MTLAPPNRVLIEGTLELATPLRLRTGETAPHEFAAKAGRDAAMVQKLLVARDCDGRPYIPGSSLKGVILHWLQRRLGCRPAPGCILGALFGHDPHPWDPEKKQFVSKSDTRATTGGKAEFHDAFAEDERESQELPLSSHVAIDRHTRTAARQKLYHAEEVPAGTRFRVVVTGDDLTEDEVLVLLAGFEGFDPHAPERITLGGATTSGRGGVRLAEGPKVFAADPATLLAEMAGPSPPDRDDGVLPAWQRALRQHSHDTARLRSRIDSLPVRPARRRFALGLQLCGQGAFLVADPSRLENTEQSPDFRPRLDERGKPVLPGSSLKGALRSQVERIWRTVHGTDSVPVWDADRRNDRIHPIEWLFGRVGFRGALAVSDFRLVAGGEVRPQEFVAIDRFTGGASEGAKFNAEVAEDPVFEGTLKVDLDHGRDLPERKRPSEEDRRAAMGALVLALRDLLEGDVPLGFGTRRGFGVFGGALTCFELTPVEREDRNNAEGETEQKPPEASDPQPLGSLVTSGQVTVWLEAFRNWPPAQGSDNGQR